MYVLLAFHNNQTETGIECFVLFNAILSIQLFNTRADEMKAFSSFPKFKWQFLNFHVISTNYIVKPR